MEAQQLQIHRGLRWLWLGSMAIGVLSDYLFYGKAFGISYPLFVFGLYALFFLQAKQQSQLTFSRDQLFAWLLTVPIVLLSLTFFYTTIRYSDY